MVRRDSQLDGVNPESPVRGADMAHLPAARPQTGVSPAGWARHYPPQAVPYLANVPGPGPVPYWGPGPSPWPGPPGMPMSGPPVFGVFDPELLALRRPTRVSIFGWLHAAGSVIAILGGIVLLVSLSAQFGPGGQATPMFVVTVAEIVFLLLNSGIAVGFLRGSRGCYLYYCTVAVISVSLLAVAVVATIVALVVMAEVAAVLVGPVILWGLIAAVWWYMLFNRPTAAYFSRRSVAIREGRYVR